MLISSLKNITPIKKAKIGIVEKGSVGYNFHRYFNNHHHHYRHHHYYHYHRHHNYNYDHNSSNCGRSQTPLPKDTVLHDTHDPWIRVILRSPSPQRDPLHVADTTSDSAPYATQYREAVAGIINGLCHDTVRDFSLAQSLLESFPTPLPACYGALINGLLTSEKFKQADQSGISF